MCRPNPPGNLPVDDGLCRFPRLVEVQRVEAAHLMPAACPGEAHVACYIGAAAFSCLPWRRRCRRRGEEEGVRRLL